jgi:hypothetical protein
VLSILNPSSTNKAANKIGVKIGAIFEEKNCPPFEKLGTSSHTKKVQCPRANPTLFQRQPL